jgi:hypothetical protein
MTKVTGFLLIVLFACLGGVRVLAQAPRHAAYTKLLQKHVTKDGWVDYQGLRKDSSELSQYLKQLQQAPPNEKSWTRDETVAYWINAYNAFTLQLVIKYYPVKSIKDIGSSIQIPFINTPWDIKFIRIGSEKMDLNHIEHGILRKKYSDPRLHMALVCASKSCPILLNEAYEGVRLNDQLNKQSRAFLADSFRNKFDGATPRVSMIFKWYAMDFNKGDRTVRGFLSEFGPRKLDKSADLDYLEYDWGLNGKR